MNKTTVQKITAIVNTESCIAEKEFVVIVRYDGKIFSDELIEWASNLTDRLSNLLEIVRNDGRRCFYSLF